jgi:hypothetical protein
VSLYCLTAYYCCSDAPTSKILDKALKAWHVQKREREKERKREREKERKREREKERKSERVKERKREIEEKE